jgi:threo-3-hydroxy-L-aspartate ammonia-lyase
MVKQKYLDLTSSTLDSGVCVSYADVEEAAKRLSGISNRTPLLTSRTVNERTGNSVYFKCENFQRAGAFKFRGAFNAMAQLTESQKKKGVLTFSSGNHAQAIALAGRLLDVQATVVMPRNAPAVKRAATHCYGAEIILYDPEVSDREELGKEIADERDLIIIPPYDHPQVIAGQGTVAKEIFDEIGELDFIIICCGGGGLLSGCAIATKALVPNCHVVGVEPVAANDATLSFQTRTLHKVHNPATVADGARTPSLGKLTFPIVLEYVDQMMTVDDESILDAMEFLSKRMKIVVEPTGAVAAAALLNGEFLIRDARIGVVLSGGNVD